MKNRAGRLRRTGKPTYGNKDKTARIRQNSQDRQSGHGVTEDVTLDGRLVAVEMSLRRSVGGRSVKAPKKHD
jgi:hypothetical protein